MEDTSKQTCPKCEGDGRAKCSNHITYACEECDGSGYIEEDCPTCHGTGEKKLDSPREKIASWFAEHDFGDDLISLSKEHQEICRDYADQIIALFPDGCATCDTPLLREGELYQKIEEAVAAKSIIFAQASERAALDLKKRWQEEAKREERERNEIRPTFLCPNR